MRYRRLVGRMRVQLNSVRLQTTTNISFLQFGRRCLKFPQVGLDDNFFELGGTSLQALMMFAEIEVRLGYSLSPTTIVQRPTIARVAEFIRASERDCSISNHWCHFALPELGCRFSLCTIEYCFVMYYRHLLSDLKNNRPSVWTTTPAIGWGAPHSPHDRGDGCRLHHGNSNVQPHGPYLLAGHSFGGKVCFEIAQQLVRPGERISFLGLIDTGLHDASAQEGAPVSDAARLSRRVYDLFRKLRWIGPALLKRQHDLRMRQHDLRIRYGRSIPFEHRPTYYNWLCSRANLHYVAKPYPGRITMFSSVGNSEQQRASWGPLARGGLTIFEIPASHDDMVLPPHSKLLAEYFDACLDETECL